MQSCPWVGPLAIGGVHCGRSQLPDWSAGGASVWSALWRDHPTWAQEPPGAGTQQGPTQSLLPVVTVSSEVRLEVSVLRKRRVKCRPCPVLEGHTDFSPHQLPLPGWSPLPSILIPALGPPRWAPVTTALGTAVHLGPCWTLSTWTHQASSQQKEGVISGPSRVPEL